MASFREQMRELAPHYAVLIVIMFAALLLVEQVYPGAHFLVRIGVAFAIAVAYPMVLRRLGMAPEIWE